VRRISASRGNACLTQTRGGLTLVEVLMSMLVMGLGVVSIMALLPLAFIRSVQATNLTNGTILRYNAESMLQADPLDLAYTYPFWMPNTNYAANQYVIGWTTASGNNHYFQVTPAGAGISGATQPTWNTAGGNTTDNTVTWVDAGLHDHYVVDPMGAFVIGNTLGTNPPAGLPAGQQPIPRFGGGAGGAALGSLTAAAQLAMLPDSWIEQARSPVNTYTNTSATLSGPDLTAVGFSAPAAAASVTLTSRVVLLDATGKVSQTRILTGIASPTVSWAASDPLPAGFVPVLARVETQEQRYTWMATVRRSSSGQASVYMTAFFHRPVVANPPDEQIYFASGTGTQFTVNYGNPKPFAKKGSFLFDVSFARWYRIVNIVNDTGTQFTVIVDQQRPQTDSLASLNFGVVFMRGIVDVFPLGNE
jgi:Tfp pilus assembly protein PilV